MVKIWDRNPSKSGSMVIVAEMNDHAEPTKLNAKKRRKDDSYKTTSLVI